MSKQKKTPSKSSSAEYLTFVASTGASENSVEMRYEDENIWLTQKLMAELYNVSVSAINQHLKRLIADSEIDEGSVIKKFLITASDGKNYQTKHYNLQAIISVGFKVENERAVQFRKWARQIVKDYTIQGWTVDSERLKQGGNLTDAFFERQLAQIREIRLSERKFYQKITDIYATSIDYDTTAATTKRFFAAVQNKLHYAIAPPVRWCARGSGFWKSGKRSYSQSRTQRRNPKDQKTHKHLLCPLKRKPLKNPEPFEKQFLKVDITLEF